MKVNFYFMARGSLTETQSHLEYARRVGYLEAAAARELDASLTGIYNDLNKVIVSLKKSGK
jgi:four helix bundle protein